MGTARRRPPPVRSETSSCSLELIHCVFRGYHIDGLLTLQPGNYSPCVRDNNYVGKEGAGYVFCRVNFTQIPFVNWLLHVVVLENSMR